MRYAQIKKEALALVYACEKFSDYMLGKLLLLETDHKPLVPILGSKSLDTLPPWVLRFRICLMRFQYSINHVPGKTLYMADTLLRAPIDVSVTEEMTSDTECFVQLIIAALPATKDNLDSCRTTQREDPICTKLIEFCDSSWPNRNMLKGNLKKYWQFRANLTVNDGLLLFGSRMAVPEAKQMKTLEKIHQGHQGFQKCQSKIATAVWWLGVTKTLENFIKICTVCQKTIPQKKEPLISSPLPSHPWEKLARDLFELNGSTYIHCPSRLLFSFYGSSETDFNNVC